MEVFIMVTALLTAAEKTSKLLKIAGILVVVGLGCQKAGPEVKRMVTEHKQKKEFKNKEA
jgi:hypothetical protein